MYHIEPSPLKKYTALSRLTLVAITIFSVLLVAALVIVVPLMRLHGPQPNIPAGSHTQTLFPTANQTVTGLRTPTSVGTQAGSLYITNSSGILKLDSRTGATLHTYPWPNKGIYHAGGTIAPYTLQISGTILYVGFTLTNSTSHLIYGGVQAFDTNQDKMLWEFAGPTDYQTTLTIANGTVYLSVDHPDLANTSLVFALKATDGSQVATYMLPILVSKLVVTNGFLYAKSYSDLYALNLTTKAHWSSAGPQGQGGVGRGYTDFQIGSGVIYASAFDGSNSYFVVLKAISGTELGTTDPIPGKIFNFIVANHIAYFGTDKAPTNVSGDNIGRFDAYDLNLRQLLWEVPAPSVARTYAVTKGTIYAVTSFPYAGGAVDPKLLAFNIQNGTNVLNVTAGSQSFNYQPVFVITTGYIYIAASDVQMEMVDPVSGHTVWKKSFSSQIGGYVLVS